MAERLALIDYGAGNLRSVANALKAAGATSIDITADAAAVAKADRIVLPGVGAFAHCMNALSALPGMVDTLNDAVLKRATPFLGICVGMQLMADAGEEHGTHQGLGWISGTVKLMDAPSPAIRIPHMGWNDVILAAPHTLLERGEAYYLHSYHFDAASPQDVLATSHHGRDIVAAVGRDTMVGVQFHPEKSQAFGVALLNRFLDWKP